MNCEERFSRTSLLIGEEAVGRLSRASVLVVGLGGVGGYTVEALARAGVGRLTLVDDDTVSVSNINRQILATDETVGRPKAEVAAARVASISPSCIVRACRLFVDESNVAALLAEAAPDYIVDAIDSVPSKIALIRAAQDAGVPIVSCMGTGNKVDTTKLAIGDINKTHTCPLARSVRARLRAEGITHLDVLWSSEKPREPLAPVEENGRRIPATISYLPAIAGLMLGGFVIRRLAGIEDKI